VTMTTFQRERGRPIELGMPFWSNAPQKKEEQQSRRFLRFLKIFDMISCKDGKHLATILYDALIERLTKCPYQ
jgi:hypothetical protein